MFNNYLHIAWRNLRKHRAFSFINGMGLAVGMAACLLLLQYIAFEWSYDAFQPEAGRKYRVWYQRYNAGQVADTRHLTFGALGPETAAAFPEVTGFTRTFSSLGPAAGHLVRAGNTLVKAPVHVADASFVSFFRFSFTRGDGRRLAEPNTVVLSESLARRLFGEADPLGKTVQLQGSFEGEMSSPYGRVTGVFRDLPPNSHLRMDCLLSYASLDNTARWGPHYLDNYPFYTYVSLAPGADPAAVARKLTRKYAARDPEAEVTYGLLPVRDIHLCAEGEVGGGDGRTVRLLGGVAWLILLIAWFNYINLSTAKALERAREVGVRKAAGASRGQLIRQFLTESLLLGTLAALVALTLVQVLQGRFNVFVDRPLSLAGFVRSGYLLPFAGCVLGGTLLAGAYPAFVLSGLGPVAALKGGGIGNGRGGRLRKLLVVAQFATCLLLLTATAVVYGQLHYMQTRSLGMDIDRLVILNTGDALRNARPEDAQKIAAFRTELLRDPSVRGVAASGIIPGEAPRTNIGLIRRVESPPDGQNSIGFFYADEHFIPTYRLQLLAGRTFRPADHYRDPEGIAHNKGVVLNYAALKTLGFHSPQEALGKFIYCIPGPRVTPVIGVVGNFHQQSLQHAVVPMVIQYLPPHDLGYQSVKVRREELPQTLRRLETTWKAFFPGIPFEYTFLDDHFNRQYQSERRFRDVFGAFAGLALLVACLGLFGLSLFATARRTREVGIRKVLGASPASLVRLLTADLVKLVAVANLLAWPVAYRAAHQWLTGYAFRIDVSPWLFVLPSLLVLAVALLTVSLQTLKVTRANPVLSLRSE